MFRSRRGFHVPELQASSRLVEVRSSGLRLGYHDSENVTTDFALVDQAAPFIHRMSRSCLTVVLRGAGRFEEHGKRVWLDTGGLISSDQRQHGTEAYTGARSSYIVFEWDPVILGAPITTFDTTRFGERDLERLRTLSGALDGRDPAGATLAILDIFRANGLALHKPTRVDLADRTTAEERRLSEVIDANLSRLDMHPSMDDIQDELGWSARHVSRRFAVLAARYGVPWEHWRAMLHSTRITTVLRLLSARGATTELVARRTGFRSPTAMCHALAKSNLPSPGVLARASQRDDVLDAWTAFVVSTAAA